MATRTPPAAPRRSPAKATTPAAATRKPAAKAATSARAPAKRAAAKPAVSNANPKAAAKAVKPRSKSAPAEPIVVTPVAAGEAAAKKPVRASTGTVFENAAPATGAQRDSSFNLLLHTACLKAGTAAAFASISAKVPVLAKLAPVLLGARSETVTLPAIQKQLVRDVLDLYALDLSDAEQRGVILLATGAELGAERLSGQLAEQILAQSGSGYLRLVTARILPLASIATDIAAAIATTYTVGKRAQVLCNLPGSGARNLGELLRALTAIDQRRLFAWSAEALRLALGPFRGVLWQLRPGA